MAKSSYDRGSLETYRDTLSKYILNKESFQTYSSGMSRRIVLPNGAKLKYFGSEKTDCRIEGAFMVNMVRKEIDRYAETYGVPELVKATDVQLFNLPLIEKVLSGKKRKPVMGIDINACYWKTALKLGYISESLYQRGLDTCKKQGLLIAIGCLNKKPLIKTYQEGKLIDTYFDLKSHAKYSPFYWNIIKHTHDLMLKSFVRFHSNWYMYLTDCLFVDIPFAKDAQKFFRENDYATKIHQVEFLNFDGKRLKWYDFKEHREKEIHAQGRDIHLALALSNIEKGMHPSPSQAN